MTNHDLNVTMETGTGGNDHGKWKKIFFSCIDFSGGSKIHFSKLRSM